MLPYKSDETLVNLVIEVVLDRLSWLRSEKLKVVLERLNILQVRSVNICEA